MDDPVLRMPGTAPAEARAGRPGDRRL